MTSTAPQKGVVTLTFITRRFVICQSGCQQCHALWRLINSRYCLLGDCEKSGTYLHLVVDTCIGKASTKPQIKSYLVAVRKLRYSLQGRFTLKLDRVANYVVVYRQQRVCPYVYI